MQASPDKMPLLKPSDPNDDVYPLGLLGANASSSIGLKMPFVFLKISLSSYVPAVPFIVS